MQKVIKVNLSNSDSLERLNEELKNGWKVVQMKDYSQNVSTSTHAYNSSKGEYGMVFVIEKNVH